jgi:transposase
MNKLEHVDVDALREALADATDPKAVKRLMIALAYDDGVPVATLSERYGIARSTVYSWLDRFEESSVTDAIYDGHRSGRPPLLDEREREHLSKVLQHRSRDVGFEQASWTPELVQEYVQREYEVSYSLGHVRRLLQNLDCPR